MPETKIARWKIIVAYVGFGLFSLGFCFYLTFPYDALRRRAQSELDAAGMTLRVGSLGPGLFGVSARNVQVSRKVDGAEDPGAASLTMKRVSVRPSLIPLGVALNGTLFGGSVRASIGGLGAVSVRVIADDLNLADASLKALTGVDLAGKANAELDLKIPRTLLPGSRVREPDLAAADGRLQLSLDGVMVNGGTIHVTIPMYGPEPTPVDLPKINIGGIDGLVKIVKGTGTIETLALKGQGIEVRGSGTLKLAKRFEYSEPNLEIRLKAEPEFTKSLGVYGMGLSALPADPKDPTWRLGRLTGYLGRPGFR